MTNAKLFIKRSIKSVASMTRARAAFSPAGAGAVNIIAYHRVVADLAKAEREAIYGIVISAATFRRHCELLRKNYDVVSLETARYFLDGSGRRASRPLAVLTFDDGYLDFYEEAFPILNQFGLPATVFLPTDCIGHSRPLAHDRIFWLLKQARDKSVPLENALRRAGLDESVVGDLTDSARNLLRMTDRIVYLPAAMRERVIAELENEKRLSADYPREYRLLDWKQVEEMARKGIGFGAHTANHVVLPLEDEAALENEITAAKRELERRLDQKIVTFAYPNGEYNARIRELVARAGFQIAVTTEKRINRAGADLLALGRISLCEESTRGVKGIYSPAVANFRLGI